METVAYLCIKMWKILPSDYKELNAYQCLNPKLKVG